VNWKVFASLTKIVRPRTNNFEFPRALVDVYGNYETITTRI